MNDELVVVVAAEHEIGHRIPAPPWMTEEEWIKNSAGFVGDYS